MDDLLADFIGETVDGLDAIDQYFLQLEKEPNNEDIIKNVFRILHTIKGTCGFLGLERLQKLAHASENVLGKMRDGSLSLNGTILSALFDSLDVLKKIVGLLSSGANEGDSTEDASIIQRLDAIFNAEQDNTNDAKQDDFGEINFDNSSAKQEPLSALDQVTEPVVTIQENSAKSIDEATELANKFGLEDLNFNEDKNDAKEADKSNNLSFEVNTQDSKTPEITIKDVEPQSKEQELPVQVAQDASEQNVFVQDEVVENILNTAQISEPIPEVQKNPEPPLIKQEDMVVKTEPLRKEVTEQVIKPIEIKSETVATASAELAPQSIKVNLNILDNLITLVSELVLTRNQLQQLAQKFNDNTLKNSLSRLSFVTTELQEEVMKTRMQPIEGAWTKIPRQIRDLAKDLGKKIKVEMHGKETELDRQVLELIKDPLTHMIRNAADHGIEMPQDRIKAGKDEEGTITLKAYHESGNIIIEITDDGKGLDPEKISQKALEKGLTTSQELSKMDKSQILNFIFAAGFSTAQAVTNVSGRGVGMDVVRTNIEKLGGVVEISSEVGKGSNFLIKIPLTLTIVSALIFECALQKFAIPQSSITELVRIGNRSNLKIEYINKSPILRLRNGTLPLINLSQQLEITQDALDGNNYDKYVMCINLNGANFGIMVDKVYDTQEIVVKTLSKALDNVKIFSGCTILGDGSVILILDTNILISQAIKNMQLEIGNNTIDNSSKGFVEKTILLIFKSQNKIKAVPLILVSRITEIDIDAIENLNNQYIYPNNNTALPVLACDSQDLGSYLKTLKEKEKQQVPILIFSDMGRSVGIIIDEILDIVETNLKIDIESQEEGSLGACIINEMLTSIVDTESYLKKAYPDWFNRSMNLKSTNNLIKPHVLIIDDNQFFRNLLQPIVSVAGYDISMAKSGDEALEMCKNNNNFDIIVSDIEMPGIDGFMFAKEARQIESFKSKPIIALSSLYTEEAIEKGVKAGFDHYVQKSDHKSLIDILNQYREQLQNKLGS